MGLVFEQQSNGYRVRRFKASETGSGYINLGIIKRVDYKGVKYHQKDPETGKGFYSKFNKVCSEIRNLEDSFDAIKRQYRFYETKRTESETDKIITADERKEIEAKLTDLNSFKQRKSEIAEFRKVCDELMKDLTRFVNGTNFGDYSPDAHDPKYGYKKCLKDLCLEKSRFEEFVTYNRKIEE